MKLLASSVDLEQSSGAVWSWSTVLALSEYLGKYGKKGHETVFGPSNMF